VGVRGGGGGEVWDQGYLNTWLSEYLNNGDWAWNALAEVKCMDSAIESGSVPREPVTIELPLWRLYTLRVAYFIMAAGLGVFMWPSVIHHTNEFAVARGIQMALLAGLGLTAAVGLRYPVQMLPILLFELTWKAIYLLAFALPLWRAHAVTPAVAEDIKSVVMVVIFVPLIPWGYVVRKYVMRRGDRWK